MKIIQHRAQDSGIHARADMVEVDVLMTQDKHLVCRHDHIYGLDPVWCQIYNEDMGPLLFEFMEQTNKPLLIELKLPELHWEGGLRDFEVAVVDMAPNAAYCSFSTASLYKLRKIRPTAKLVQNLWDKQHPNYGRIADAYAVPTGYVDHYVNLDVPPLFVYTVNDPRVIHPENFDKIEGIITDNPGAFV